MKKFLSIVFALMLMLAMVSCGNNNSGSNNSGSNNGGSSNDNNGAIEGPLVDIEMD